MDCDYIEKSEAHLGVGIDVHFDDAAIDSLADLVLGRARATVEDEEAKRISTSEKTVTPL
jgi:hypothetical protein